MEPYGAASIAGGRFVPLRETIVVSGADLTNGNARAQVRLYPDAPGAPLLDLIHVASRGFQGVALVSVDRSGVVPVSVLEIAVDVSAMTGLPPAAEIGDAATLAWDLVADIDTVPTVICRGTFIVCAGVTQ